MSKIPDTRSKHYDRGRSRSFKYFDESCPIVDKIFEDLGEELDHDRSSLNTQKITRMVENACDEIKNQVTYKFRDALTVALMEKLELEEQLETYSAKFLWLKLRFEKLLKLLKRVRGRSRAASSNFNISELIMERLAVTITQGATSAEKPVATLSVISPPKNSLVANTFVKIIGTVRQMVKTTVTSIMSFTGLSVQKKGRVN